MKKQLKKSLALFMVICTLLTSLMIASPAFAATPKGAISSVANTSSGIKVKWTKDSTKTGYYIYRRASGGSWKSVKKITSNSTTSWTDKNVTNGTRYVYRVRSYKGSKITSETKEKAIYRLTRPSISSISSKGVGSIYVKTGTNSKASGYEIKYAKKSDFSDAKTLKCAGTKTVDTTICDLGRGSKYYVKVRAYYNASGKLFYSAYSATKTCTTKSGYTAYTKHLNTSVYSSASTSSTKTTLRYMSKVTVLSVYSIKSSGTWQKISYNGKTYYTWLTGSVSDKFTKTKISTSASSYTSDSLTKYQNDVITLAMKYVNSNTAYVHGESNGVLKDGRYGFDCSGFVSFIMDSVMKKYVPVYHINSGIEAICKTTAIYNKGTDAEFAATTVCSGTLDYSKMQPGDVIFWNLEGGTKQSFDWNHCGIYIGNKLFIHATPDADGVVIYPLEDSYVKDFYLVKRFLPTSVEQINETKTIVQSKEKVFATPKYVSGWEDGTYQDALYAGDEVKVLFTSISQNSNSTDNWAYVSYVAGGVTKTGYIYNPDSRLS